MNHPPAGDFAASETGQSADPAIPAPHIPFNRLKQCRHGMMLYNVNDTQVGRSLDLYGEWCQREVEIFQQVLRPGGVVIDAGANIGAHTVAFANLVGPGGTVIAFEPQRVVFQTLCANVANNSLANVFCYQAALGDEAGILVVPPLNPRREQNFGGFVVGGHEHGEPVATMRLDDLPLHDCRLLKIDVEGMELQVLRGAGELIKRCWPILYVENNRTEHSPELVQYIYSLGYDLYWHEPAVYNPSNYFNNPNNVFGDAQSHNMLCLRPDSQQAIAGLKKVTA